MPVNLQGKGHQARGQAQEALSALSVTGVATPRFRVPGAELRPAGASSLQPLTQVLSRLLSKGTQRGSAAQSIDGSAGIPPRTV